jgi:hypothetical protein
LSCQTVPHCHSQLLLSHCCYYWQQPRLPMLCHHLAWQQQQLGHRELQWHASLTSLQRPWVHQASNQPA